MNTKFWHNLAALVSIQAVNYLVPMFTLPFLTRILGAANWGALAFAEGYATYISLIIEFGFGLSASRDIAQLRHDEEACSRYSGNVFGAQLMLFLIVASVSLMLTFAEPSFRSYKGLLPVALLLGFSRAVFPSWLFQGLERMGRIALLNIMISAVSACTLFAVLRPGSSPFTALVIRTVFSSISAIIAIAIVYRWLPARSPSFSGIVTTVRQASPFFLLLATSSLYTSLNVILMGMLGTASSVAWFAGAERIAKAALSGLSPVTKAFYPRISYLIKADPTNAARTARQSFYLTMGLGTTAGAVLFLGAPQLVAVLLGKQFLPSIPVLRILSALLPLVAAGVVFGFQWMLVLRLEKIYTWLVLSAGVLNILLAKALVPIWGPSGMAVSVVVAELLVNGGIVVYLVGKRLDPWSATRHVAMVSACAKA